MQSAPSSAGVTDCRRDPRPLSQRNEAVSDAVSRGQTSAWRMLDEASRSSLQLNVFDDFSSVLISEVRMNMLHARLRTSESKGHWQLIELVWFWFRSPHNEPCGDNGADF
jgi:hypothetical protein